MSRNKNNNELEGIKKIAETYEAFEFASSVFYELKEALFGEKILKLNLSLLHLYMFHAIIVSIKNT